MKRFLLLLLVLFLCLTMHLPAADEDDQGSDSDKAVVAQALSKIKFLKGKPSPKAKYYIYLHSASWCGPCRKEMPTIVKCYKKMKKYGFEIILFGHDDTDSGVVAYAKSFKAKFPMVKDDPAEWSSKVPGYKSAAGIPHMIMVDKSGKEILRSHPASFFHDDAWKRYIEEDEKSTKDSSSGTSNAD